MLSNLYRNTWLPSSVCKNADCKFHSYFFDYVPEHSAFGLDISMLSAVGMYNLHTILAKLFRRVSVTRSQICCFPLLDPSEKKTNYMPWQHIFSVFLSRRVDVKCIIYEGTELNRRYSIRPSAGASVENWTGWDQLG